MVFSLSRSLLVRFCQQGKLCLGGGAVVGALALGACSNTSPTYYTLMQHSGSSYPASLGAVRVIKVFAPSVPEQLDRDTIVLSGQSYRMVMEEGATWSEPLGTLIGHTLASNLRERLPGRVVFSQNDTVSVTSQADVSLSVSRFDIGSDNHAVIEGILSIKGAQHGTDSAQSFPVRWVSSYEVRPRSQALVEALSEGLGVLSDQAAYALSALRVPQSE